MYLIYSLPGRAVDEMMRDLPLKKLRNFGGKLGAELAAMGCATAGQVAALPHAQLTARFGEERAAGIARAVRGYSDEPVQVSARVSSRSPHMCCSSQHPQLCISKIVVQLLVGRVHYSLLTFNFPLPKNVSLRSGSRCSPGQLTLLASGSP